MIYKRKRKKNAVCTCDKIYNNENNANDRYIKVLLKPVLSKTLIVKNTLSKYKLYFFSV